MICASPSTTRKCRQPPPTTTSYPKCFFGCRSCASSPDTMSCVPCRSGTTCCTRSGRPSTIGQAARIDPDSPSSIGKRCPPTASSVLFKEYFERQGKECIIVDPREVEYRRRPPDGRRLSHQPDLQAGADRRARQPQGLDNPIVRAVRDGAVCMVNPFRCKILYKKASLAVLSDERNEHLFNKNRARGDRPSHSLDALGGRAAQHLSGHPDRSDPFRRQVQGPPRPQAQRRLRWAGHRAWLERERKSMGGIRDQSARACPMSCKSASCCRRSPIQAW